MNAFSFIFDGYAGALIIYMDGEDLVIGPILIAADEFPDSAVRIIADQFWNAFHFTQCPLFDAAGKFKIG